MITRPTPTAAGDLSSPSTPLARQAAPPAVQRVAWFGPRDDRRDPWSTPGLPPALLQHAARTCYLVGTAAIARRHARRVRLNHVRYGEYHGLCRDDPFWCQPIVIERDAQAPGDFGHTGYLLDSRTVLTCWHGWEHFGARATLAVFGHHARADCDAATEIPAAQVLPVAAQPARVPAAGSGRAATADDWVLLRLEHPVTHLGTLAPPRLAAPRTGAGVYTLGHPSGLPLKLADGARVLAVDGALFRTDLDTFVGNSGSPVFDAATHELVGLVLAGQDDAGDFEPAPGRGCYVARETRAARTGQLGVTAEAFASAVAGAKA
ncbi:MAG: serine protease [Steroidobacteraceae bacterium]|nr:serine protease [Steroidobacteraceae bacterium]